jgi:hypothetical protein
MDALLFVAIKIESKQKGMDDVLWNLQENGYLYYFFMNNDGTSMLFVYEDEASYAMTVLEDYDVQFDVVEC